jgi:hypothetical protein
MRTKPNNLFTFCGWPPRGQNQEGAFQGQNPALPPALDSSAHRRSSQKQQKLDRQEVCTQKQGTHKVKIKKGFCRNWNVQAASCWNQNWNPEPKGLFGTQN